MKLSILEINRKLMELALKGVLLAFDAVSLYPSALSDPKSIQPKIETQSFLKVEKMRKNWESV